MKKQKWLNFEPKMPDLRIFGLEFENNVVICEISTLKLVQLKNFVKKQKCLNLGPKMPDLSIFAKKALFVYFLDRILENYFHISNQHLRNFVIEKFCEVTKMLKFGTKNVFFMYFSSRIWKQFCYIWNQSPWICLTGKYCEITKMFKFGTESALFGYFWEWILKSFFHIWNQHLRISVTVKFCEETKWHNLEPKMPDLGIVRLEFENNIIIFEISTLYLV